MKTEILELEKILNEEIEAYTRLEKYILKKRDSLISGDLEKLKNIDDEIEKFGHEAEEIETKRIKTGKKLGNENLTLKEIIERIEEEDKAENFSNLRTKLKTIIENINRQNKVNTQLIEHSLKIVEHSIVAIANILIPEATAYNNFGKISKNQVKTGVSSVIHEV